MAHPTIPTETLKFTQARPHLSELLNRVFRRQTRILIQKGSIPVAAIVSVADLERLNALDADWEQGFAVLDDIGAAFKDESPDELERATAQAVDQARAELRAERAATVTG